MYCDGVNWYSNLNAEAEERNKRLNTPSFAKDLRDTSSQSFYTTRSKFTGEELKDVSHIAEKLRTYLMNYTKTQKICTYSLSFNLRLIPRSESNSSPYKEEFEVKPEGSDEVLFVADYADLRTLETELKRDDLLNVKLMYSNKSLGTMIVEWDY